jgi:RNA polymerase sigma factor (sigma-70 family)
VIGNQEMATMSTLPTDSKNGDLEAVVRRAINGDRASLGQLAHALQDDVFGLSLRMLGNVHEAEDATQEILVRVVTRLAQFDGQSSVRTWAFRVAVNYILDIKKSATERLRRKFVEMAEDLSTVPTSGGLPDAEESLYLNEVKASCSLGMLQCLDAPHRAAFVLGHILELPGEEAASVLEISPDLYRKRLQLARTAIVAFIEAHCGLVSDNAPCRCNRLVVPLRTAGKLAEDSALPRTALSFHSTRELVRQVERAQWALQVHRSTTPIGITVDFARRIMDSLAVHMDGHRLTTSDAHAISTYPGAEPRH